MAARRYGKAFADNALSFPSSPSNRFKTTETSAPLFGRSNFLPNFLQHSLPLPTQSPSPSTITPYLPCCPILSRYSIMELRSAWLAVSVLLGSGALLMGLVSCVSSHLAMLARSYLRTWGGGGWLCHLGSTPHALGVMSHDMRV